MKPILQARLQTREERGLVLASAGGVTIRIVALQPDLIRVTMLRDGRLRQDRTWSVPPYGREDTEWAGRARLDDLSWPAIPIEITATEN